MSSEDQLVRWGLHLLDVPGEFNRCVPSCTCSAAEPDTTSNTSNASSEASTRSDEALAIRLQEQFYLQDSKDPQIGDFFDAPCPDHRRQEQEHQEDDHYHLCDDCSAKHHQEEQDFGAPAAAAAVEMGNSSSRRGEPHQHHRNHYYEEQPGSSYNSNSNSNENDEVIAAVLSEELQAQYDGEVGRRLTHMESIPHVPKINGEIPSADAATLDHQRLLERLQVYGLTEHKIPGDGNCQFRALSDQFYRTPDHHMFVRKEVIKQLKQDPYPYEGYVPMQYSDYLKKMAKSGEWGDHVTLQAAADAYGMKICLITSFRDTCIIDIFPKQPKSERVIFLSFWAEVHYNSVYPEGEAPVSYQIKKKKHWFSIFG